MAHINNIINLCLKYTMLMLIALMIYISLLFICQKSDYDSIWMAQADKIKILKKTKSPKLVLVGGSNLAFGIDSELISKTFNIPVINTGLHAGFGIKYMLDSVKPFVTSDDIVVIVPEYELFTNSLLNGGSSLVELGLTNDDLPLILKNWRHLLEANKAIFYWKPTRYLKTSPYRRSSFNGYGDLISHLSMGNKVIIPYKLDNNIADESFEYINKFYKSKPGIKLFVVHPSIMRSSFMLNNTIIKNITDKQNRMLHDILLSSSTDFVFDDKYFFDTVYHLNAEGRRIRTNKLITFLKGKL